MNLNHQAAIATSFLLLMAQPAFACQKPKPGTYWLGWGEARLIVPSSGRPYQYFRNEKHDLPGKYCMSGDNAGAVRIESNGKAWAYTPSPD
jgi:hypothetical protein